MIVFELKVEPSVVNETNRVSNHTHIESLQEIQLSFSVTTIL